MFIRPILKKNIMNSKSDSNIEYLHPDGPKKVVKYEYTLMLVDDSDIELKAFSHVLSDFTRRQYARQNWVSNVF